MALVRIGRMALDPDQIAFIEDEYWLNHVQGNSPDKAKVIVHFKGGHPDLFLYEDDAVAARAYINGLGEPRVP